MQECILLGKHRHNKWLSVPVLIAQLELLMYRLLVMETKLVMLCNAKNELL